MFDKIDQHKNEKGRLFTWHWSNLLRLRWQIICSVIVGIAVPVVALSPRIGHIFNNLGDHGLYMTFLLGIASILALVGSITFGFLLHYIQSVSNEKYQMYFRFKDCVKELRNFLDGLYETGVIDEEYDYHLGLLRDITIKDFPLPYFNERVEPLIEFITVDQKEALEELGEFGRVLRGVAYSVKNLEEMVGSLFENFIKQVLVKRMVDPVIKTFWTLAVVVLTVLLSSLYFDHLPRTVAWGIGLALGFMTFLLLVEIAMIVRRETREYYEYSASEDKDTDGKESG